MEGMFQVFFNLGLDHILDIQGYDHMLFLLALCIPFVLKDWKKVLVLATAFTIGHSITLGLSALDIVTFPSAWIEFLIPLTIVLTAIIDLIYQNNIKSSYHYLLAMFFGFIHGMGFSNFFKSSMMPGEESRLITQLLSFNIGIEIGQIIIVILLLIVFEGLYRINKGLLGPDSTSKKMHYRTVLSIIVILWAGYMCIERIPSF